jgi:hypothetical protein
MTRDKKEEELAREVLVQELNSIKHLKHMLIMWHPYIGYISNCNNLQFKGLNAE